MGQWQPHSDPFIQDNLGIRIYFGFIGLGFETLRAYGFTAAWRTTNAVEERCVLAPAAIPTWPHQDPDDWRPYDPVLSTWARSVSRFARTYKHVVYGYPKFRG